MFAATTVGGLEGENEKSLCREHSAQALVQQTISSFI
jgi:hypothetical protein